MSPYHYPANTIQLGRGIEPKMFYCWASVVDSVPILKHHRLSLALAGQSLYQCLINAGPQSVTLAQHKLNRTLRLVLAVYVYTSREGMGPWCSCCTAYLENQRSRARSIIIGKFPWPILAYMCTKVLKPHSFLYKQSRDLSQWSIFVKLIPTCGCENGITNHVIPNKHILLL